MDMLVLAGGDIGLLLLCFLWRFLIRHFFSRGGMPYGRLYLAIGLIQCECELFSAGARGCQGGSVNWYFERQLNVLRSLMKNPRTLMKRMRTPSIAGVCLSSGFENRSETSRFDSVFAALLRDVSVNLLVTLVRATLRTHKLLQRWVRVKFILFHVAGAT